MNLVVFFFFQAEDGIRDVAVTGVQTCALPISAHAELMEVARRLNAPVVHSLRGKEFIEYENPFDVGLTGLLGFSSGYHRSEEHTSELQSRLHLVCRLLLEKKKKREPRTHAIKRI